ncbi:hypothetical protein C0992_008222 [Termitomyces sp. T32_za158]|nr:hypothetical protein C0992_008222 [Termitomyces sp. T32_za158]
MHNRSLHLKTMHEKPAAAPLLGSPHDDDACSDDTLCYVNDPAPPQSEPASFYHDRLPHFDLCQTHGHGAPPPPEPHHFNPELQRPLLGPPPAAPIPSQAL